MAAEKRDLKQSYLSGDSELLPFTKWPWPIEDYQAVIDAREAVAVPRQLLVAELAAQNAHLPNSKGTLLQIAKLGSARTFTVTTGHQVCLLGGPMFTLYKIATTIALAQSLKERYPAYEFVPILWMATEDHDWEEVNHFYPSFAEKRTYSGKFKGPVGRHVLEPAIHDVLQAPVAPWVQAFYQPGRTMGEAFRGMMHHLFGAQGLVIVDADRWSFKAAFSPIMAAELQMKGIAAPARATTEQLESLGFKPQILPRAINLFYVGDGDRSLIDYVEGHYQLKGQEKRWTEAEILAELAESPEHFSPNVALRPVYQETLLPNVATVGGWAEVSYWLQLKAGFEHLGVPFPPLIPRMHATLVTKNQANELDQLGLPLSAMAEPLHVINDRYLQQHWDESPLVSAIADVHAAYERLAELVATIDPTQATGVKAEQAKSANALESLPKKLKKALRNRNPQPYQQIATLKNSIEPENASQQRVLNFTAFDNVNPLTLVEVLIAQAKNAKSDAQWITLP